MQNLQLCAHKKLYKSFLIVVITKGKTKTLLHKITNKVLKLVEASHIKRLSFLNKRMTNKFLTVT